MKKLFLLIAGAATLSAAVPAHADPLPKVYVGTWCLSSGFNGDAASAFSVDRPDDCKEMSEKNINATVVKITSNGYTTDVGQCRFLSVRQTKTKLPLSTKAHGPEDWTPVVRIKSECKGLGQNGGRPWHKQIELGYAKGTLLFVTMLSDD
jgi:hypothetical protein